ncbi:MAG: hypothetical protein H7235_11160 [Bdellovibrionaceae bacterium]|nr:hypothetical protein [Pseudobdellovibrionaceae bacterium]
MKFQKLSVLGLISFLSMNTFAGIQVGSYKGTLNNGDACSMTIYEVSAPAIDNDYDSHSGNISVKTQFVFKSSLTGKASITAALNLDCSNSNCATFRTDLRASAIARNFDGKENDLHINFTSDKSNQSGSLPIFGVVMPNYAVYQIQTSDKTCSLAPVNSVIKDK